MQFANGNLSRTTENQNNYNPKIFVAYRKGQRLEKFLNLDGQSAF